MKVISWNVRGINGLSKHRMLRRKIHQEKPTILMIQETKSTSETLQTLLAHLWKNSKSIAVDVARASGGLAITWDPSTITLNDFTTTRNSISASYHLIGTNMHGFITFVYGPQSIDQKTNLLNFLDWYKQENPRQNWILGGDFNLITNLREKKGGTTLSRRRTTTLKTSLRIMNWLIWIPPMESTPGTTDTGGNSHIASHLDRFLVSEDIATVGDEISSSILPSSGSDHWPIFLHWHQKDKDCYRPFRFEKFWLSIPEFKPMIQQWWSTTHPLVAPKCTGSSKN
jgi:hypothetical protein